MLTLTPNAAAVVTSLLDNADLPESASVRIQPEGDAADETSIGIAIVDRPGSDDEQVPAGPDSAVFVASDIAELLDGQVLDAEIEEGNVAFTLRPQPVDGRPPNL
jgi:Fe-S cluster assembly iron-binding protein IscA